MTETLARVVVVGSLNIDYTLRVPRIPAPGETLTARSMFSCLGGKGANQAVAAARAGARAAIIGCVGEDESGTYYLEAGAFANAAGALATQNPGAQPSIPWREAILALGSPDKLGAF